MDNIAIFTDNAPKPKNGYYSQAILHSSKFTLELAGQVGIDPRSGKLVEGLEAQTHQVLDNLGGVLAEVGWGFKNITKARIYLTNAGDYETVNGIYIKRFSDNPPSRAVVTVRELPAWALIEIEGVAVGDEISEEARIKYF